MFNYPILFFPLSIFLLWLSARIGVLLRVRHPLNVNDREDFGFVQAATLTLLALIIGFSFSMAIGRYDLRKNYEEEEANAIETEYIRAGLLPSADASQIRALLEKYLDLRIAFYRNRDQSSLRQINAGTVQMQTEMWSAVQTLSLAQQTPIVALTAGGMTDVLKSKGYTQAAWWNRIPVAAWCLMIAIAIGCNLLVGYGTRNAQAGSPVLMILPLALSVAFLLIADIDSPRGALIDVPPQNLASLSQSLPRELSK